MTIPLSASFVPGGPAPSVMAQAIKALYGVATDLNEYLNSHIELMKASDNSTVSRSGRVLEMAKFGFGLGYMTSTIIIAAGQLILGNTLAAFGTVATAATLTNPIAMTCAAIGAVVYGWSALSDQERNDLLAKMSRGLEIGVELITAVVLFVIGKMKEMLDSKVIQDLKHFIADKAALFGKNLSDVTHQTVDVISDTASAVVQHANIALLQTTRMANDAGDKISDVASSAAVATSNAIGRTLDVANLAAKKAIDGSIEFVKRSKGG